jgi:hypothetical protein
MTTPIRPAHTVEAALAPSTLGEATTVGRGTLPTRGGRSTRPAALAAPRAGQR